MAKMKNSWKRSRKSIWIFPLVFLAFFPETKLVCSLSPPNFNRSEVDKFLKEETEVADKILVGYDKRFIPIIPGVPLEVKLQVVVADVLKIANMEAEMIIFIRQTWYDYRLSWNGTRRLKIREHFLDKIWLPDVRIINLKEAKRFEGFGGVNMNIYPSGRVYFSQLVHVKTSCPKDLHRFPMDRQTCFLNFSSFAYGKTMLNFSASGKDVEVRHHRLPQFEWVEAKEIDEGVMSKFTVALTFQRRAGYYILQVYIPASFLVILSWLSFFMESSDIADRLALEITMILSTVFLLDGINDTVVHVSYAKASDWFVITSFGFIFVALLETMLVYRCSLWEDTKARKSRSTASALEKQLSIIFLKSEADENDNGNLKQQAVLTSEPEDITYRAEGDVTLKTTAQTSLSRKSCPPSRWIDKVCIILFPMMYLGFNIGYWYYYWP